MRSRRTATSPASASNLDTDGDRNKICRNSQAGMDPTCEGPWRTSPTAAVQGRFNDYTMEVVQQIGSDSFSPGHGVLIGKSKTGSSTCGTYNCFVWYIDSNPQDIDQVDFVRPDGTSRRRRSGDERQLNDGTFNAGVNSGGEYEYIADANKLHFYILDKRTDAQGILRYKVGIRSLEGGAGPQTRGVRARDAEVRATPTASRPARSRSRTRARRRRRPTVRTRQDASAYFDSDIYRLSVTATGTGWEAHLQNALATAKFGETRPGPGLHRQGRRRRRVGLRDADRDVGERSDQDGVRDLHDDRRQRRRLRAGDAVADDGQRRRSSAPFTPGAQKDYFATTTANVISTAGDATLSVADPATTNTGHLVNGAFVAA